ncbi:MAG: methionine--tRNA ligase [Phenylobacterium sp.]|uniref:methionine--tRNA ligase n=2 Tax=Phenylobacterium sp. TaxID=1871053 RepID=UPI0025F7E43E|nr:methionine--tRNA ligase [Phenylobacterium sp.]MCA3713286.1 methionine--tRNA ligase [Phenylobacterium sp.]MCA6239335.1 methionine--tRNA ligase [Phenylobacterium sp.]MCA6244557.1 methionine--tRNA ligase [Phenylobacterium sp.]MCA6260856.1 methionine--tRNA ligase [Phenylobacterium sp.]MCA6327809.1 methionine--tRNA ligase [Phenylobacterium sp.]
MTRILITSALPYINGIKHLGTLAGSMLPADVYARFKRAQGLETLYICATDEHGTPTELAAAAAGIDVASFCRQQHEVQARLAAGFGLSWDHFGRSSSPQNRDMTQAMARQLWESGFIEERVTQQVYSNADHRFLPDRYVIGTCPHCGYAAARGDQCENCTRVLDPADLIQPRSAVSGSDDIEIRPSKHLFLRQSLFAERLRAWIEGKKASWPLLVTSIALKWLDEGLQDRGITRDLEWGVPVNAADWGPNPDGQRPDVEGLKGKVFYVWFDAPIEYIGATREWADATGADWERWWRGEAASDVTYVQFMGKDNVPFHTVGFPCTLIGVNERLGPDGAWTPASNTPWKLVDRLKGFNWLDYYGGRFSTSQQRGVFMDQALELLPADYWRWWIIANAPEGSDASFVWEQFQAQVNADLADVFGNFINRILRFTESRFDGKVPDGGEEGPLEARLRADVAEKLADLTAQLEALEMRKSAQALRQLWVLGNQYLTEAAPWTAVKTDRDRAAVSVRMGLNLVALFARVSRPFIPFTCEVVANAVGEGPDASWPDPAVALDLLPTGREVRAPDVLFRKVEAEQVEAWRARFGGPMAD